uniref:Uncharacterized protein n=1 Tax=viral metagenome TaxID=1070528 RepID=A0A6H1ZRT1_9ZZZZ
MFQIPCQITKITTMRDRSIRLQIDTQEISTEEKALVFALHDKLGWMVFKETPIEQKDLLNLPDLPPIKKGDKEKTDSQRQRAVLYLLWKQGDKKDLFGNDCDDEIFYHQYMNKIIEHLKSKLQGEN